MDNQEHFCMFCQLKNTHAENCISIGLTSEQKEKIEKVMSLAVSVIYLSDNSDYLPALKNIVNTLAPDIYEQLHSRERDAFVRVCYKGVDDEKD